MTTYKSREETEAEKGVWDYIMLWLFTATSGARILKGH